MWGPGMPVWNSVGIPGGSAGRRSHGGPVTKHVMGAHGRRAPRYRASGIPE